MADQDLENIFLYSKEQYGLDKATAYLLQFESLFDQLLIHPQMGRTCKEIREGLRSVISGMHAVFYRIKSDHNFIVRVLHGRLDLPEILEDA